MCKNVACVLVSVCVYVSVCVCVCVSCCVYTNASRRLLSACLYIEKKLAGEMAEIDF